VTGLEARLFGALSMKEQTTFITQQISAMLRKITRIPVLNP
jgi:hypothetical protein